MSIVQIRSRRKFTGGINKSHLKKNLHSLGRAPTFTRLGKRKTKVLRVRGGKLKTVLLSDEFVNLFDKGDKGYKKVKIKTVLENPANRHFIIKNIMTKGTIIETEVGKARITSRPGQEGTINAVLV